MTKSFDEACEILDELDVKLIIPDNADASPSDIDLALISSDEEMAYLLFLDDNSLIRDKEKANKVRAILNKFYGGDT